MWLGMLAIAVAQVAPGLAAVPVLLAGPLLGYLGWVAERAAGFPLRRGAGPPGGPAGLVGGVAALIAAGALALRAGRCCAGRRRRRAGPARASHGAGRDGGAGCGRRPVTGRSHAAAGRARGLVPRRRAGRCGAAAGARPQRAVRHRAARRPGARPPGAGRRRSAGRAGPTHAEADHEGMALAVIRAHRPRLVLDGGAGWPTAVQRGLPAALAAGGGRAVAAQTGQVIRLGTLGLRILWPPAPRPGWRPDGNPNDRASSRSARGLVRPAPHRGRGEQRDRRPGRASGRGAQGGASRQRRPGPARAARTRAAQPWRPSRSAATTPTVTRRPRRWPRCAASRDSCAPIATARSGCVCGTGGCGSPVAVAGERRAGPSARRRARRPRAARRSRRPPARRPASPPSSPVAGPVQIALDHVLGPRPQAAGQRVALRLGLEPPQHPVVVADAGQPGGGARGGVGRRAEEWQELRERRGCTEVGRSQRAPARARPPGARRGEVVRMARSWPRQYGQGQAQAGPPPSQYSAIRCALSFSGAGSRT